MTAHECMTRVMYFESNRSSPVGMLAVGTVVMNRVESQHFPDTVCGVVAQPNQFAPGVTTRRMGRGSQLASEMATKVLNGGRHRYVGKALYFHTAGMTFPYTNMHYLVEAGGNVFYDKRKNARSRSDPPFVNPQGLEAANRAANVMLTGYQTAPASQRIAPQPQPEYQPRRIEQPAAVPLPEAPPEATYADNRPVPRSAGSAMLQPVDIDDLIRANGGY
ncbi:cell wall hydrolase [Jiella sp. CQZ9-1]|uniref:Cell wall hydrolase n=2 Tax=Jiella flava TaxID=2816857 RepID=A0A939G080_9HYPH|nr:cell wall hydrolase [Jiella flava]